jgi:hypothetical protein
MPKAFDCTTTPRLKRPDEVSLMAAGFKAQADDVFSCSSHTRAIAEPAASLLSPKRKTDISLTRLRDDFPAR